jgi:hypothetical protein
MNNIIRTRTEMHTESVTHMKIPEQHNTYDMSFMSGAGIGDLLGNVMEQIRPGVKMPNGMSLISTGQF